MDDHLKEQAAGWTPEHRREVATELHKMADWLMEIASKPSCGEFPHAPKEQFWPRLPWRN